MHTFEKYLPGEPVLFVRLNSIRRFFNFKYSFLYFKILMTSMKSEASAITEGFCAKRLASHWFFVSRLRFWGSEVESQKVMQVKRSFDTFA